MAHRLRYALVVSLEACFVRTAGSNEMVGQACWILEVAPVTLL